MTYQEKILHHYKKNWNSEPGVFLWDKGPFEKLPYDFRVLEFEPGPGNMWRYATCCMSQPCDIAPVELHIFSSKKDENIIELLTAIAFYHRNGAFFNLHHTLNFGRPWQDSSLCDRGLVSLPYLDGPDLENMGGVKFYWLIPVTQSEVEYKTSAGIEALELLFETKGINYLDPQRVSLI